MTTIVPALAWALVLTACSSLQQPETTAPSPDPSGPEVVTEVDTPASRSVLDGVFTARQASGGETTFQQVCEACHSISEFRGGRFRLAWAGFTVGDLFQSVSTLMPKDDPGSLSPEQYSAIISYLLRENGYTAGEEDLASDVPALRDILIEAAGP